MKNLNKTIIDIFIVLIFCGWLILVASLFIFLICFGLSIVISAW